MEADGCVGSLLPLLSVAVPSGAVLASAGCVLRGDARSSLSPSSVMKFVMTMLPGGDMLAASCRDIACDTWPRSNEQHLVWLPDTLRLTYRSCLRLVGAPMQAGRMTGFTAYAIWVLLTCWHTHGLSCQQPGSEDADY